MWIRWPEMCAAVTELITFESEITSSLLTMMVRS
jgi:hypothetical protein